MQYAEAGKLWPDGSQIADDDGKSSLTMEWEHYLLRNLGASNRDCPFAAPIRGSLPITGNCTAPARFCREREAAANEVTAMSRQPREPRMAKPERGTILLTFQRTTSRVLPWNPDRDFVE